MEVGLHLMYLVDGVPILKVVDLIVRPPQGQVRWGSSHYGGMKPGRFSEDPLVHEVETHWQLLV